MDNTVVCTNSTPGFTTPAYGCSTPDETARPNMRSSLEKPNTNPSDLSISTISRWWAGSLPTTADNKEHSQSPPKPAPRMKTRMIGTLEQRSSKMARRVMTAEAAPDPLRERVLPWLGKPLSGSGSAIAPDEVNV